ncbi:LOW QUALITY PROTEIN: protein BTG3-like [Balaenoptera ricei]|uniref:LOW QUALITY PROTEIN: protein BTG3-like n=1 Tax=Balaenoptera ricei TaxID=2746895 RepID=UPI0028BF28D7|nr:LOW QUALITY PROTEIN: protein BTG3-like [Balaenoptera ricei]
MTEEINKGLITGPIETEIYELAREPHAPDDQTRLAALIAAERRPAEAVPSVPGQEGIGGPRVEAAAGKLKNEIAAVVFFFTRLVRKHDKLKKEAVERSAEKLTLILQEKYKNQWYPEKPSKGQAYRCIRVNMFQRVDPDVLKACENSCCILYSDLCLPKELTLWVDPCEVCCRYGEKNNAFIVASFENEDENKDEISKKVRFQESDHFQESDKVTSDYHSGSSSSDEETSKEVEVKPNSGAATPSPVYQISELKFPPLPMWHPLPRKKPGMYRGNGHQSQYPPPVPFGYPNQGRKNKPYRPSPVTWVPPPGMHCDRNHWINPHMLAPH